MSLFEATLTSAAELRLAHGDGALDEALRQLYAAGKAGDSLAINVGASVCDLLARQQQSDVVDKAIGQAVALRYTPDTRRYRLPAWATFSRSA